VLLLVVTAYTHSTSIRDTSENIQDYLSGSSYFSKRLNSRQLITSVPDPLIGWLE